MTLVWLDVEDWAGVGVGPVAAALGAFADLDLLAAPRSNEEETSGLFVHCEQLAGLDAEDCFTAFGFSHFDVGDGCLLHYSTFHCLFWDEQIIAQQTKCCKCKDL